METNPTIIQSLTREQSKAWTYLWESQRQGAPEVILQEIEDYIDRLRKAVYILEHSDFFTEGLL